MIIVDLLLGSDHSKHLKKSELYTPSCDIDCTIISKLVFMQEFDQISVLTTKASHISSNT